MGKKNNNWGMRREHNSSHDITSSERPQWYQQRPRTKVLPRAIVYELRESPRARTHGVSAESPLLLASAPRGSATACHLWPWILPFLSCSPLCNQVYNSYPRRQTPEQNSSKRELQTVTCDLGANKPPREKSAVRNSGVSCQVATTFESRRWAGWAALLAFSLFFLFSYRKGTRGSDRILTR